MQTSSKIALCLLMFMCCTQYATSQAPPDPNPAVDTEPIEDRGMLLAALKGLGGGGGNGGLGIGLGGNSLGGLAGGLGGLGLGGGAGPDKLFGGVHPWAGLDGLGALIKSGPVMSGLQAATSPKTALVLSDAVAKALGIKLNVGTAATQMAAALGLGGKLIGNALDQQALMLEQLTKDILDTHAQIIAELAANKRDIGLAVAFAPYKQASAAVKLLGEAQLKLGGPGGLIKICNTIFKALADPIKGLPGLVGQTVAAAGYVVDNPLAIHKAIAQSMVGMTAKLQTALVAAANMKLQHWQLFKPVLGFTKLLHKGYGGMYGILGASSPFAKGGLGSTLADPINAILSVWKAPLGLISSNLPGPFGFGLFRDAVAGAPAVDAPVAPAVPVALGP